MIGRFSAFQFGGPGSIPGKVRDFKVHPGTGVCPHVFCPVLSLAVALSTDSGRPVLVCASSDLVHKHPTHGHLDYKSRGMQGLGWEKVNA